MAAPQSTPLPPAPVRNEPEAVFIPKSNAFLGALEPLRVDLQAQADYVNTEITGLAQAVTDAQTAATAAGASEANAAASESAVASDALTASSAATSSVNAKNASVSSANDASLSASDSANAAGAAQQANINANNSRIAAENSATASAASELASSNSATTSASSEAQSTLKANESANSATASAASSVNSQNSADYAELKAAQALAIKNSIVLPPETGEKLSFDSLTSAIATISSNPTLYPDDTSITTASYRSSAECTTLGIDYPDGGGASYIIGAGFGADDGGSIIDAGTKQLKQITTGSVTVKSFGAIGNGVADDLIAIQAAVDSPLPIDTVEVTGGVFYISDVINLPSGRSLVGSGSISFGSSGAVRSSGTVDAEIALTVAVSGINTTSLTVASGHGYTEGDLLYLQSSTNANSVDAGDDQLGGSTDPAYIVGEYVYFGEYVEIHKVVGDVLELRHPTVFTQYPLSASANSGARTVSTVRKVNAATVHVSGITFQRLEDAAECIMIEHNRDSTVSGCTFNNCTFSGSSVTTLRSFRCETVRNIVNLDAETEVTFGTANPGFNNYFQFNAIKIVGSQNCIVDGNSLYNGTQNIDVTRFEEPSVNTTVSNNNIVRARYNAMTTHDGSFSTSIVGNIMTDATRGISSRCPSDKILNNVITGFKHQAGTDETSGDTSGVSFGNGFNRGASCHGNHISGFEHGVWSIDVTSTKVGFDSKDFTITGNVFENNVVDITIDRSSNRFDYVSLTRSNLAIVNNVFSAMKTRAIDFTGEYIHGVTISGNTFNYSGAVSLYAISSTEGNCRDTNVSNNTFNGSGKRVMVIGEITDASVGVNSPTGSGTITSGNVFVGSSDSDVWVYGSSLISKGQRGFTPLLLSNEFLAVPAPITELPIDAVGLLSLSNTSGGNISITNFTGYQIGQEIVIYPSGSTVTFVESANIVTKGGVDLVMSAGDVVKFIFRPGGVAMEL